MANDKILDDIWNKINFDGSVNAEFTDSEKQVLKTALNREKAEVSSAFSHHLINLFHQETTTTVFP